jgi:circadian clock protein KaiC
MYDLIREFRPAVVAVDPISNFTLEQEDLSLKPTLMRLIDFLKSQNVTALFTTLTSDSGNTAVSGASQVGVSSLMDTWLILANLESNAERTRTLQVFKSRGMAHSNQVREFVFSNHGLALVDVYLSGNQVLTGTARVSQEEHEKAANELRDRDQDRRLRELANHRKAIDAQIALLNAQAEERAEQIAFAIAREKLEADAAARSKPAKVTTNRRDARARRNGAEQKNSL